MATLVNAPTVTRALPRVQGRLQSLGTAATTIYYVTAAGAFGSTTDPSAVPSTAGIVRRVTT